MAGVKVALFDLDDTLFAHTAAVNAAVAARIRTLGWPAREDSLALWHELEELHYHRYLAGELTFLEQRAARATDFAAAFGVQLDRPLDFYDAYFSEYERAWSLHDDALPCLDALSGLRLGIITNGETEFQLAKISSVGILDRFEHVIASGELGVTKPDPRIFEHAAALFGVAVADAAYVGDRFETDALGASRAGLTGVWLDRLGNRTPAQAAEAAASGVHIVSGLAEVPALLV
ncbi:HAD family hydrolase [soil metagenome]